MKDKDTLATVRQMVADGQISQDVAEKYFPDMAESEDEKIRNFISNELACLRATDEKGTVRYNELTRAIAWLEKQGEQKPAWGEEDEEIYRKCICAMRASACGFPEEEKFVEQVDNWLKSLKDRVQQQPMQEWSEEDKAIIDYLLQLINNSHKEPCTKGLIAFGAEAWLKSLRPQVSWKPSKEMLEALYRVIPENVMEKSDDDMLLDKLYQGLKYGKVLSEK